MVASLTAPATTDLPAAEYARFVASGTMRFHTLGCSGDPDVQAPQAAVADALLADLAAPNTPAFLFHLATSFTSRRNTR